MKKPPTDPLLTPPRNLSVHMRSWVANILERYVIEPEDFTVLVLAAQAWDDAEKARAVLVRKGSTFLDRWGCPKNRPEVSQLRDARIAYARLMSQLALGDEEAPESKTRPRIAPTLVRKG
jgi:phage terminase small subunit